MSSTDGVTQSRYDYDLWGKRTKLTGTVEADKGFTGHFVHSRSSLVFAPYRAYSAEVGRWINRDPLGEAGGLNLYGYVSNRPASAVDPLGLSSLIIDGSCKGHEDLLQNITYFSEDEPKKAKKVLRNIPAPGNTVMADAVYMGDGTAYKIPDTSSFTIRCVCDEDGVWSVETEADDSTWAFFFSGVIGIFTDRWGYEDAITKVWPEGYAPPRTWPNGDSNRQPGEYEMPPYNGVPPEKPLPPLNPAPTCGPATPEYLETY